MSEVVRRMVQCVPWSLRNRIRLIPGLAAAQRALVSKTLDGREFVHVVNAGPARGICFKIRMPDDKGIWTGTYEVQFATRVADAVKLGSVAYDIGGWHGFFSGVMSAQGAAQVHVFEPLPANIARIQEFIGLNPEKSITLHNCAVGEHDGEMDLLVMQETSMAKLETSTFQIDSSPAARIKVILRSIDSVVAAGAPPPNLIKIDVEGAEVMVLSGALNTLRRYRPVIFIEVHSSHLLENCKKLLAAEGYWISFADANPELARAKDIFQIQACPL